MTKVAFFDMGIRNFAFIVEEIDSLEDLFEKYSKFPKKDQMKRMKPHSNKLKKLMDGWSKKCRTHELILYDPNDGKVNEGLTIDTRRNVISLLDAYYEQLKDCEYVGIEEQFYNPKAGVTNLNCIRLAEIVFGWFLMYTEIEPFYVSSTDKTSVMGCPRQIMSIDKETGLRSLKTITKYQRKKWSAEEAQRYYELRKDEKMLKLMTTKSKRDDIADCLMMVHAWALDKIHRKL